jgi:hypothetical protein
VLFVGRVDRWRQPPILIDINHNGVNGNRLNYTISVANLHEGVCMATIEERKNKEGEITYGVKVRLKGEKTQEASFKRKTDAKKWAGSTEAAIREGRHF